MTKNKISAAAGFKAFLQHTYFCTQKSGEAKGSIAVLVP